MTAIQRACEILGGQVALARALGVTPQFVNQLVRANRSVPAHHCRTIEDATDGRVTRYQLRPDVFGEPDRHPVRRSTDQVLTPAEVLAELGPEAVAQAEGGTLALPEGRG